MLSGVHDAVRQGVITELEATGVVGLLVIAGHDTTTGLVANALVALGRHPEVEAQLRGDRSLIPAFVEEVLRVDAPVQHLGRWAATDFEHHGVHVSAGDEVVLLLGSANRDETVWRHVDRVSLAEARISPHLAFGWGRHRCLGATLARMEGELAVQAILDAFDDLTPLEPITYREPANVRCPNRIVLGLEP